MWIFFIIVIYQSRLAHRTILNVNMELSCLMIINAKWVCKVKLYTYTFPSKNKYLILECTVDIISKCFNNNILSNTHAFQ